MEYVILGGSIAGISAARAIRGREEKARITVITEEETGAYYRPMIPFLIEKQDIDIYFEDDPFEQCGLDIIHERAVALKPEVREVILSSGRKVRYDRLLIATGGSPVVPEIPGLREKGFFTLRTMADAVAIREHASGKKKAMVIGGGLVGLKAAVALLHVGLSVTIVERLEQILPRRLDRRGAQIIEKAVRNAGISVVTGDTVASVRRARSGPESAELASGRSIPCDMIIAAVGVRPNVDFLKGSGIKVRGGIRVDEHLRTSVPDVYAAGDVVEYADAVTGDMEVSGLWTTAEEMGKLAGRNMTGSSGRYKGFLSVMNATSIFNIPFISLGLIEPEGEGFETVVDDSIGNYRKLVFRGDHLMGAVFVGDLKNAGIYTNLIRNRYPVGNLKAEAIRGNLGYVNFLSTHQARTPTG